MFKLPSIQLVKSLLQSQGYDVLLRPCAKEPYNGPKVAFVHIAKCGGISIDTAIRQAIASPNECRIDREHTLAASIASFNKTITSDSDSCDFSEHHADQLTGILRYFLAKNWNYVSGHITIDNAVLDDYKHYNFVTVLRDPVERFISNYLYNKKTNNNNFMRPNKSLTDNLIYEAKEILNSRRGWQMANTTTMFLTGRYPKNAEDAKSMQPEVAHNLSKFSIVGFLDNLSQFATNFFDLTDRQLTIPTLNKGPNDSDFSKPEEFEKLSDFIKSKQCILQINKLCRYEIQNYEKVKNERLK